MNLQEWNQLCRKSWENDNVFYKYRFDKMGEGKHTIRTCNRTIYIECTPETKPFWVQ